MFTFSSQQLFNYLLENHIDILERLASINKSNIFEPEFYYCYFVDNTTYLYKELRNLIESTDDSSQFVINLLYRRVIPECIANDIITCEISTGIDFDHEFNLQLHGYLPKIMMLKKIANLPHPKFSKAIDLCFENNFKWHIPDLSDLPKRTNCIYLANMYSIHKDIFVANNKDTFHNMLALAYVYCDVVFLEEIVKFYLRNLYHRNTYEDIFLRVYVYFYCRLKNKEKYRILLLDRIIICLRNSDILNMMQDILADVLFYTIKLFTDPMASIAQYTSMIDFIFDISNNDTYVELLKKLYHYADDLIKVRTGLYAEFFDFIIDNINSASIKIKMPIVYSFLKIPQVRKYNSCGETLLRILRNKNIHVSVIIDMARNNYIEYINFIIDINNHYIGHHNLQLNIINYEYLHVNLDQDEKYEFLRVLNQAVSNGFIDESNVNILMEKIF